MANEKSRNHETGGGKSGGASKHQGKPDDQDQSGAKSNEKQDSGKQSTASGASGSKGSAGSN